MANAGGDVDLVLLDLHATAAAVPQLTAGKIPVEGLTVEDQTGRQPLDDAGEAGTVRFAGGDEFERHGRCRLRGSGS